MGIEHDLLRSRDKFESIEADRAALRDQLERVTRERDRLVRYSLGLLRSLESQLTVESAMNEILRALWHRCTGMPTARPWDWDQTALTYHPGRLMMVAPDGAVWEITARRLAPHDPEAVRLVETLEAIDRGEVE